MMHRILMLILCALNMHQNEKCRLHPRIHFSEPLPILIKNGRLLEPTDGEGNIEMAYGEVLTLSCESGGIIRHPHAIHSFSTASVTCAGGDTFKNDEWLNAPAPFPHFICSYPPNYRSQSTERKCYDNNSVIEVGYTVRNHFYPIYETCFNEVDLHTVYSKYTQKPYNAFYQTRVDRPFFIAENNYGTIPVDSLFSPRGQKEAVAQLIGDMTDNYITKNQFLARGHLAAKTDFVFAFGERATFHYVNCAPQWSGFNGGNWNTLEVDLRQHISNAGYNTVVYTGTFGVTQLTNEYGRVIDIYLHTDINNNPVIPVPQYFYKVVYETESKLGTAFVGINNPYYTHDNVHELVFCEDHCRNNPAFSWLTWHPDNFHEGYTFCCTVDDFRMTIPHLPKFKVNGLLT